MNTLRTGLSVALLSSLCGCGQQLVEFPPDLAAGGEFASLADATGGPGDASTTADLVHSGELGAVADLTMVADGTTPVDAVLVDAPLFTDFPVHLPDLSPPPDGTLLVDGTLPIDLLPLQDLSSDAQKGDQSMPQPNPLAACAAKLGSASSFAVLGGATVTNTGPSQIAGDVGVSPGKAIVGIPAGQPTGGSIHAGDPVAAQAQMDLTTVFNCTQGAACKTILTGTDLGGKTLPPGVYCFASSAALNGVLALDAQGDPNAIWFFQIMSTLTVANNAQVHIIGGGSACNVFWQVGSSVTIGTGAAFVGNLLSFASVTLQTGARVVGRALARVGAVTMDSNIITRCN